MIEAIVRFLEDGNWHTLEEIRDNFDVLEEELEQAIEFLEKFGFLYADEKRTKVRLSPSFLALPVEGTE